MSEIQLTYKELKSYPQFKNAKETFRRIQKFGKRNKFDDKRDYQITEMMSARGEDKIWWNSLAGFNKDAGDIHMEIGWLLAHGFPAFAKHYHHPIYIAFDHADEEHCGWYRLTTYCQEKERA